MPKWHTQQIQFEKYMWWTCYVQSAVLSIFYGKYENTFLLFKKLPRLWYFLTAAQADKDNILIWQLNFPFCPITNTQIKWDLCYLWGFSRLLAQCEYPMEPAFSRRTVVGQQHGCMCVQLFEGKCVGNESRSTIRDNIWQLSRAHAGKLKDCSVIGNLLIKYITLESWSKKIICQQLINIIKNSFKIWNRKNILKLFNSRWPLNKQWNPWKLGIW